MSERNYLLISAIVFALIAFLHLLRVITHWSVQIGTMMFPIWGSWLAIVIGIGLSVWAFRLMSGWRRSHP
jgi:hypothetical protein